MHRHEQTHTHTQSIFYPLKNETVQKEIKSEYTLYDTSKSNCQRIAWRMRGRGFLSDQISTETLAAIMIP